MKTQNLVPGLVFLTGLVSQLNTAASNLEQPTGNETLPTASEVDLLTPSQGRVWSIATEVGAPNDVDWFKLSPEREGNYEIMAVDGTPFGDAGLNLEFSLFNASGDLLGVLPRRIYG